MRRKPSSGWQLQHHDENYSENSTSSDNGIAQVASGSGFRYVTFFPWRLHEMLEEVENSKLSSIVAWLPEGDCFKVYDTKRFAEEIIPNFFKQKNYKSFQRQLQLYGFRRLQIGPNQGETDAVLLRYYCSIAPHTDTSTKHERSPLPYCPFYEGAVYHPNFIRGNRHLTRKVVRAHKRTIPTKQEIPIYSSTLTKPMVMGSATQQVVIPNRLDYYMAMSNNTTTKGDTNTCTWSKNYPLAENSMPMREPGFPAIHDNITLINQLLHCFPLAHSLPSFAANGTNAIAPPPFDFVTSATNPNVMILPIPQVLFAVALEAATPLLVPQKEITYPPLVLPNVVVGTTAMTEQAKDQETVCKFEDVSQKSKLWDYADEVISLFGTIDGVSLAEGDNLDAAIAEFEKQEELSAFLEFDVDVDVDESKATVVSDTDTDNSNYSFSRSNSPDYYIDKEDTSAFDLEEKHSSYTDDELGFDVKFFTDDVISCFDTGI
jgi:hypothetical protein